MKIMFVKDPALLGFANLATLQEYDEPDENQAKQWINIGMAIPVAEKPVEPVTEQAADDGPFKFVIDDSAIQIIRADGSRE